MSSHFGLKSVIQLSFVVFVSLLAIACSSSYQVGWDDVQAHTGATTDDRGDVLIVGGSIHGPSASGGQAEWMIQTDTDQISKLSIVIATNGQKYRGKGIHSTRPNGTVDIYINDVLVHTITCNVQGGFGDYWPQQAAMGSAGYDTGTIDVLGQGIRGPTLDLKIVTGPRTALDINNIKLLVTTVEG